MHGEVVLFSGGLDSTVALIRALHNGSRCLALHFTYGSKHERRETERAEALCRELGVEMRTVSLPLKMWGVKSGLLGDEVQSPVVPFRNGVMLSIAASIAESEGFGKIVVGSHISDDAFPDCREDFSKSMADAVLHGTGGRVQLETPFSKMSKGQVVALGRRLGVDFSKTWSCYRGGERPCGQCEACIEREKAFREADNKT